MTVCYFGIYNPKYSRNRVLISGLLQNDIGVLECRTELNGIRKYFDLIKKHWKIKKNYDVMIVGFPGYQVMILARFLTRKRIIFDAFASLFDSMVCDRKLVKPISFKAYYFWILDWLSCNLANKILLDTNENIKYFIENFGIKKEKFIRVLVGSDNSVVYPINNKGNKKYFLVHFHGKFIPLQGIEYIIRAAKILDLYNIRFNIIGNGQEHEKVLNLAHNLKINNVNFVDFVPYEDLKNFIGIADLCLGIFGKTEKSKRVIPNKIFEYLACRKPIITGNSPAILEILNDDINIMLCNMADEKDLANKILQAYKNRKKIEVIAEKGSVFFNRNLTPYYIVNKLLNNLK